MKSSSTKAIRVTLILDEMEARWLKIIMQNPFHEQPIKSESQTDKTMRKIFWDALDREGVVI